MREHLEQEPNKLLKLLSTAPADFKIYYSKKKLQTTDDEIQVNVCGSYCILFIYMNLIKYYSIAKFQRWLLKLEKDTHIPRDVLVANIVIPDTFF
jgi:hypothetical protein